MYKTSILNDETKARVGRGSTFEENSSRRGENCCWRFRHIKLGNVRLLIFWACFNDGSGLFKKAWFKRKFIYKHITPYTTTSQNGIIKLHGDHQKPISIKGKLDCYVHLLTHNSASPCKNKEIQRIVLASEVKYGKLYNKSRIVSRIFTAGIPSEPRRWVASHHRHQDSGS